MLVGVGVGRVSLIDVADGVAVPGSWDCPHAPRNDPVRRRMKKMKYFCMVVNIKTSTRAFPDVYFE
jgi:hypothetical protein